MGLDSLELIMAVEKTFEIETSDDEGWRTRTPRQLCEVVSNKIRLGDPNLCLTQRAFYLIRRAISKALSLPKQQLMPATKLEAVIPATTRRTTWLQLRREIGANTWPELKLPRVVANLFAISLFFLWLTLWAVLGGTVKFVTFPNKVWFGLLVSSAVVILVAFGGLKLLEPLRVSLPGQTMGTLAARLVASDPQLLGQAPEQWTQERIRAVVRGLISEQLGIPPDFDDDADFVRDLKVD